MADLLYIGEDFRVTLTGLSYTTDAGAVAYLNAATVTYALKSAAGAAIAGGTGSLSYVAASNGNYAATGNKAVTLLLSDGALYFLEVTIAEGGRDGFRRLALRALYRGAT